MKAMPLLAGFVAVSGCMLGIASVQGSGKKATSERKVEPFTNLALDGSMDVVIGVGTDQNVVVEGDDNIVPLITTKVSSGTLTIDSESGFSTKVPLKVRITVPKLKGLTLNGSGSMLADGVSGKEFKAMLAGSGDMQVKGSVSSIDATLTGSGRIRMQQIPCESAKVLLTGSGDIEVSPTQQLDAKLTGSGRIVYFGFPNITKDVTGSGEVIQGKG